MFNSSEFKPANKNQQNSSEHRFLCHAYVISVFSGNILIISTFELMMKIHGDSTNPQLGHTIAWHRLMASQSAMGTAVEAPMSQAQL